MKKQNNYKIDQRYKNDILQEINELAKAYTPEWKFDEKNPDVGSVIGMIFANQMMGNVQRYNQVLDKYRMEFANMYGVIPKPARPAKAIVTMKGLGNSTTGVHIKKGTQLAGEAQEGNSVIFETLHDVYVTNAKISQMLNVSKKNASVTVLEDTQDGLELFSAEGANLRNQTVSIYHSYLFDGGEEVKLYFKGSIENKKLSELFTDTEQFRFLYLTEQGLIPVEEVKCEGDIVVLRKHCSSAKIEKNGQEMAQIVIEMVKHLQEPVYLQQVKILTENHNEKPQFVSDGSKEMDVERFMPFYRQPAVYSECHIGNDRVFAQKGAEVTLEFELEFDTYTVDPQAPVAEDLRIIKRKPRYQANSRIAECYVQEISIEYYNGKEYKRLPCKEDVSEIFMNPSNTGVQRIVFDVPEDWKPVVKGGDEKRSIRIQIVRADNCFFTPVTYCYPIIKNLKMHCNYLKDGEYPEVVEKECAGSVLDITSDVNSKKETELFEGFPYQHNYWYIGFDKKLNEGPIGIFLWLKENMSFIGTDLEFQYSTENGFKPLNVIDHTKRLESSGVIFFEPPSDMKEQSVEGKKCWWIRVEDRKDYFDDTKRIHPVLKKIILNGVEAKNIETQQVQEYTIEVVSANMKFPLYADHILATQVWVNEKGQLSLEQMKQFLKKYPQKVQAEYNMLGEIEDFFVLWNEVDSLDFCDSEERVYRIDRMNKQICFGDGKNTRIPQNTQGIAFKVIVQSCKGKAGNVEAGQIESFQSSMLFVDEVENPVPAYGGSDMENVEATLNRGSIMLSGRKRLVSEQDYLREVKMFSDVILDAACICKEDVSGKKKEDILSIVLLMKDYKAGGFSFRNIETELKEYLLNSCEMVYGRDELEIVQPIFVKISLDIWLENGEVEDTYELRQRWIQKLEEYLEPVREDGSTNWEIGKLPTESQIRRVLSTLEDEIYIKYISVKANYTDMYGGHEVRLSDLKKNPFMVCCNGTHKIYNAVSGGGKS